MQSALKEGGGGRECNRQDLRASMMDWKRRTRCPVSCFNATRVSSAACLLEEQKEEGEIDR